ncbi:glycosyltransferase, partial [uncultured Methylobacterium sp.]|uniref:glycosyltransferase n=1 Tax=uncultured Methylobacterium sp. TaxID=157278 RepID=UPI0035C981A6
MNEAGCTFLIIVPLYRAPELIEGLFANLRSLADEITALGARVVFINDSPDDSGLAAALALETAAGLSSIDFEVLTNEQNIGFVKSANRGLLLARDRRVDALLLNSDVLLAPGALREMRAVSKGDPLIAVVSARSNNATISNSPYAARFRDYDFAEALAAHDALVPYMPQVSYVPTAVGFCLYIRCVAILEFGLFDEIYGAGYNEENDFIMRCSRHGYRAVLANRAFAYHLGSVSFDQSGEGRSPREAQNRIILDDRYPEYARAIERYFEGTEYRAQLLCSELLPDRQNKFSMLFDCRNMGCYYNGTFEHAKRIVQSFSNKLDNNYQIFIACDEDAYEFHELGNIQNVSFVTADDARNSCYSFSVRIGQPFEWSDLVDVCSSAPISGFLMLDTIAMDCLNLDENGLERMWRQMLNVIPLIGFNSRFTRDQFVRRFPLPDDVLEFVSLCSTDVADYAPRLPVAPHARTQPCILVVGNHFQHKNVRATVALLKPHARTHKIVVLGIDLTDEPDIISYKSGYLSEEEVDQIYASATVVL